MQLVLQLLLLQWVFVEWVGRLMEHPMGLGDQLVEGRMVPRNKAEIHLCELIDNCLS